MVNLKAKPFYLSDEDIKWVNDTISSMTDEEKVGQLFFQLTAGVDEEYLKNLMEKYHLGGCRYNNMPAVAVQNQNAILQKYAKIPLIIACNTEAGGDDGLVDGLMETIIDIRKEARAKKDWATSDIIRDKLASLDIVLKDGKEGTTWSKK